MQKSVSVETTKNFASRNFVQSSISLFLQVVLAIAFLGSALAQQIDKQQQSLAGKDVSTGELAAAESSSYGRYRSGGYGGSGGGGNNVDPRYFDRGDTPHFGLAGFPFGCK